jgi:CheY-like chemotaxis protein
MNQPAKSPGAPWMAQLTTSLSEKTGPSTSDCAISMLIVCEDPQVLRTLSRALDRFNVNTTTAEDALEATDQLQRARFDTVIIDFQQPDKAAELLRTMRASKLNRTAMLIAIAETLPSSQEAFRCGATFTIPRLKFLDQAMRCLRSSYFLILRNKRASVRFSLNDDIRLIPNGDSRTMEGRLINLSETGLKLSSTWTFRMGETFDAQFQLSAVSVKVRAKAIWIQDHEVGGQFVNIDNASLRAIQEWINSKLLGRLS